jgi:hypothetical protein
LRIVKGGEADDGSRPVPGPYNAAAAASQLLEDAVARLEAASGAGWYAPGGAADRAALTLCRLRRAEAGAKGSATHGDEAVRAALSQASPEALIWIASRAISYMDESDFPFLIEQFFPGDHA